MNSIHRPFVLVLWLISMAAGAAAPEDAETTDEPSMRKSLLATKGLSGTPSQSSNDAERETIMRRLRAIVEELRRRGPPPVDCMEG